MNYLEISPAKQLKGRVVLPASKSISNRALLINALGGNTTLPKNLSNSDDTQVMLRALQAVSSLKGGKGVFDIGAAGTAMRFMTAYLSVTPGEHVITGTERMKHRPIGILVNALRTLGADVEYVGEEGFPPLRITGKEIAGGKLSLPADVSSQFISALLMIGPVLRNGLTLNLEGNIASRPYLDMTISVMRDFGAKVEWQGDNVIEVLPGAYMQRAYAIESDWSAASYWYEMVALSQDADAEVDLVGLHHDSIQGDSRVWRWMGELGVETQFYVEPDGTDIVRLRKGGTVTSYFSCDFTHQPDLAQTFAVTCAMMDVPFHLCGLQSLRIKETDRIAALMKELGKMVEVEVEEDELHWDGSITEEQDSAYLIFDTYEDHRMAMAFAPVCLRMGRKVRINNPQVVSKSYPAFWDDLEKVGFRICKEQ